MNNNLEELVWIYERLSKQINIELDLLTQRATLMIGGNAFLLTATAISSKTEGVLAFNLPTILIYGSAIIGIILCLLSFATMKAALKVMSDWEDNRRTIEEKIKKSLSDLTFDLTPHKTSTTTYIGDLTYKILPFFLLSLWVAIIIVGIFS